MKILNNPLVLGALLLIGWLVSQAFFLRFMKLRKPYAFALVKSSNQNMSLVYITALRFLIMSIVLISGF